MKSASSVIEMFLSIGHNILASSIIQRSSAAFFLRVVGVGLSFLVSVLFARALGVEQYGLYVYWMTAAAMTGTLLSIGTPSVVARELAIARGVDDAAMRDRVIRYGLALTGLSALLLTGIGIVVSWLDAPSFVSHFWQTAPFLAFAAAAIGMVTGLSNALLIGFERIMASLFLGLVVPSVTAIGAAVLWVVWRGSADAGAAMLVALLAATISASATTLALIKLVSHSERSPAKKGPARTEGFVWLSLGVILALNQFLTNAITQTDILMLGWLSTPESTAHYHAASRVSYITAFFFGSITGVIAPTIARLHAAGQYKELAKTVQNGSLLAFVGTVVLSLVVLTLGDYILMLFGKSFVEADRVIYILVLTWVLHAAFGLNHTILTMTWGAKIGTLVLGGAVICNISLNYILIPLWGAEGAAVSSLISTVGFTLVEWLIVLKGFGYMFDVVNVIKNKYFKYAENIE